MSGYPASRLHETMSLLSACQSVLPFVLKNLLISVSSPTQDCLHRQNRKRQCLHLQSKCGIAKGNFVLMIKFSGEFLKMNVILYIYLLYPLPPPLRVVGCHFICIIILVYLLLIIIIQNIHKYTWSNNMRLIRY